MKVTLPKADLKKAVSITQRALSKVVIQEERSHLLFNVKDDSAVVSGTNNDLKARVTIPIESEGSPSMAFTLDPKILRKLLPKLDGEKVQLELDEKELVVRIYTEEGSKSYASLQSFPPDKMLTFESEDIAQGVDFTVNRKVALAAISYAENYLPSLKEDRDVFDFLSIHKGIVYAANGSNKLGFLVSKAFEEVSSYRLRKTIVPLLSSVLGDIEDEEICLRLTTRDIGIVTTDGRIMFTCLQSNTEAADIPMKHLKSEGAHTVINKAKVLKMIDRVIVPSPAKKGTGIELTLSGAGPAAHLDLGLLSTLKSNERLPCVRTNDDSTDPVSHVVEYTHFRSILSSLNGEKEVRFHINDDNKFFKIYESGKIEDCKYVAVGVGAYFKVAQ